MKEPNVAVSNSNSINIFNIPLGKDHKANLDSIEKLSTKLLKIYTENNLNKITARIIQYYKSKEFNILKDIANSLNEYVFFGADQENYKISKYFTKLVIMYHPDKTVSYNKIINTAMNESCLEDLQKLNHIFITVSILNGYKRIPQSTNRENSYYEDFAQYDNNYEDKFKSSWDHFSYYETEDIDREFGDFYKNIHKTFYDIFERSGSEDKSRIELSYLGMEDLDGIEDFIDMYFLDLSGNKLTDISNLWNLERLEELYLANNQIFCIDSLCNMNNLRILDLANNNIDDISDLNFLYKLEFINLINNPVPEVQIEELKKYVKIVLF
ncbi:MAG: leucine-rich repeat domain-containing protein [Candidatus Delongbacteria bacterium]|nr:leucine-rich repeat domain-containing protein [Candidatus Delongbacteria bacterium]